jgi:hypothetical protein
MTHTWSLPDAIFGAALGAIVHGLSILVTSEVVPTEPAPSEARVPETRFQPLSIVFVADCGERRDCIGLPPVAGVAP